jgi:hypothetical protein
VDVRRQRAVSSRAHVVKGTFLARTKALQEQKSLWNTVVMAKAGPNEFDWAQSIHAYTHSTVQTSFSSEIQCIESILSARSGKQPKHLSSARQPICIQSWGSMRPLREECRLLVEVPIAFLVELEVALIRFLLRSESQQR